MKILQIVTFISDDAAYGGPVRVALNQAYALASLGHEVEIIAAYPGKKIQKKREDGVTITLFPAIFKKTKLGFSGYISFPLFSYIRFLVKNRRIDICHIHYGRELIPLISCEIIQTNGVPTILQTHGMVDQSDKLLAKVIDFIFTKKGLRNSEVVLAITEQEMINLRQVQSEINLELINNGIKLKPVSDYTNRQNLVLFLARLQTVKRPTVFVEMARIINKSIPELKFLIAGPDEGELQNVEDAISQGAAQGYISLIGAISPNETESLFAKASIYVLPSLNETFPMSLLEAFQAGTPSVVTSSLEIADKCKKYGAAIVTDGSPNQLAQGVIEIFHSDKKANELRAGAYDFLDSELNIDEVVSKLVMIYDSAITTYAKK